MEDDEMTCTTEDELAPKWEISKTTRRIILRWLCIDPRLVFMIVHNWDCLVV